MEGEPTNKTNMKFGENQNPQMVTEPRNNDNLQLSAFQICPAFLPVSGTDLKGR